MKMKNHQSKTCLFLKCGSISKNKKLVNIKLDITKFSVVIKEVIHKNKRNHQLKLLKTITFRHFVTSCIKKW